MVCYAVPLGALLLAVVWRKAARRKSSRGFWLNLMLLGAALFGVIDHWWNGELFLISTSWLTDLALGFTITGGVLVTWGIVAHKPEIEESFRQLGYRIGILR